MPRRFSTLAAPPERPLPLWILYPLVFTGLYLTHSSLLRLPYFWDEAGYYIPAAFDFFRTGSLIPHSTLTNAHPPLPSVLLSAWWHLAGTSIQGTRTFLCIISAAALLGVFRLARILAGTPVAIAATLLTALYPVWFTQSTLAHADLFAAVFTLWALSYFFERRHNLFVAVLFALAAVSKETAIVTPVALALWLVAGRLTRNRQNKSTRTESVPHFSQPQRDEMLLPTILALLFPLLPLAAWYAYHYRATGFTFGNPEFLRYNATANLAPLRILLSLWHRFLHLSFHMNLWVPIALTLAVVRFAREDSASVHGKGTTVPELGFHNNPEIAIVLFANALAFSILGGALLTRYLLPMYPLVLTFCITLWRRRTRLWPMLAALTGLAFVAALLLNPPYSFAPEDNLTYRDFVTLHQRAISVLSRDFPQATVLTAWPATAELTSPDLGYLHTPIRTVALDNFSAAEIQKAAEMPGAYDTALLFSTKYVPPPASRALTRLTESTDTRFFDFHRDLSPVEISTLLHGQILWQASSHGEWAAILRFPRSNEACLRPTLPVPHS